MIKVASAWGAVGGSTIALNNLVNLFNSKGYKACLYTPGHKQGDDSKWEGINCRWSHLNSLSFDRDDIVIYHFLNMTNRPPVKKLILSCHETNLFPLKDMPSLCYDNIQFVSKFQKDWQGVDGWVIPNVITKYMKGEIREVDKVAGIIGSIDPHKCVHESIQRALRDEDVSKVIIYGSVSDPAYFVQEVAPLLSQDVIYCGVSTNMQEVYDQLDVIYSSSKRECLPMIQGECLKMGIEYRGYDFNTRGPGDYECDDDVIMEKWKKCLEL